MNVWTIAENPQVGEKYLVQRRRNGPLLDRYEPALIRDIRSMPANANVPVPFRVGAPSTVKMLEVQWDYDHQTELILFGLGTVRFITQSWKDEQLAALQQQLEKLGARIRLVTELEP